MKILMLTPYLPYPPSSGGQVRSYNLIKNLSKHHDIYLVSLIKSDEEKQYKKNLAPYCKEIHYCKRSESPWTVSNVLRSILGLYPLIVVRNSSPDSKKVISELLQREKFDLIHAETFYIMPHIPRTKIPILLVEQTIEYKVYQHFVKNLFLLFRPFFIPDIIKLKYWEITFWKRAQLVGAVSKEDEHKMKELIPGLKTTIIPNAAGEDLLEVYARKSHKLEPIFLYQGNFSWLQNVEAAQILIHEIFPRIKEKIPNAKCIIAGQRTHEKLGEISDPSIEIVDILPSDVESVINVYKRASIFLAPIEGPGGTRLKILAAMAAGLPVISTPTGISGLDIEDNRTVLLANAPQEFADRAVELLNNVKLYETIKTHARKLVDTTYSWTSVSKNLENDYRELTQSPSN